MLKVLQKWLDGNFQREDWALQAPDDAVRNTFNVVFKGKGDAPRRRALKAMGSLRNDKGEWDTLFVPNESNQPVRIFVGEDKSPKQRAIEMWCRRTRRALQKMYPALQFNIIKKNGIITCGWKDLAKIDVLEKGAEPVYAWKASMVAQFAIDKKGVVEEAALLAPKKDEEMWCG
eukprot:6764537-Karenia_brevis.AAC.1